jgi:integrase
MSNTTLNRVMSANVAAVQAGVGSHWPFAPHDFRGTGSTALHEAGFSSDWIEKCLAHEQRGARAVYNKTEYAEQRQKMMHTWADMIDEWADSAF